MRRRTDDQTNPLAGLLREALSPQVIADHPEYADWVGPNAERMPKTNKEGVSPRMHMISHQVVENQLKIEDMPEVREALDRLMKRGRSRHEAMHEIAGLLMSYVFHMLKEQEEMDHEAYKRDLRKLGR